MSLNNLHTYYGRVHTHEGHHHVGRRGRHVTLIGATARAKVPRCARSPGWSARAKGDHLPGASLGNIPAHLIVEMGVSHAPEGRKIFSTLTVQENLNMGAYRLGSNRARISANLERVFELFPRIKERRRQIAGTLSGGEQQMLCIGRALMGNPKLLLLDEPSLGLAPMLVKTIFDTIRQINDQGVTIPPRRTERSCRTQARRQGVCPGDTARSSSPAPQELLQDERRAQGLPGRNVRAVL